MSNHNMKNDEINDEMNEGVEEGIGLVFAGGGGKGAYEIGVWKYLQEIGLTERVTAIAGTSVGALNAALFVGAGYDKAEEMWKKITPDKVMTQELIQQKIRSEEKGRDSAASSMPLNVVINYLKDGGLFSREGLLLMMDESLDYDKIRNSHLPVYVTCLNKKTEQPEYFRLSDYEDDMIRRLLLASSAIPHAFPPEEINGVHYEDGGVPKKGDNEPIRPLYELGIRTLIVVCLKQDCFIDRELFPDARIIQILPSESLGEFVNGVIDFDPEHALARMELGYQDARRIFAPMLSYQMLSQTFPDADQQKEVLSRKSMEQIQQDVENLIARKQADLGELADLAVNASSLIAGSETYLKLHKSHYSSPAFYKDIASDYQKLSYFILQNMTEAQYAACVVNQKIAEQCERSRELATLINEKLERVQKENRDRFDAIHQERKAQEERLKQVLGSYDERIQKLERENKILKKHTSQNCTCGQHLEENQYICPKCGKIHEVKMMDLTDQEREQIREFARFASEQFGGDVIWSQNDRLKAAYDVLGFLNSLSKENRNGDQAQQTQRLNQMIRQFLADSGLPEMKDKITIAISGTKQAGKTTLLNGILGQAWVPVESGRSFPIPTEIYYGEEYSISLCKKAEVEEERMAALSQLISNGSCEKESISQTFALLQEREDITEILDRVIVTLPDTDRRFRWLDLPTVTAIEGRKKSLKGWVEEADLIFFLIPSNAKGKYLYSMIADKLNELYELCKGKEHKIKLLAVLKDPADVWETILARWKKEFFPMLHTEMEEDCVLPVQAEVFLQLKQLSHLPGELVQNDAEWKKEKKKYSQTMEFVRIHEKKNRTVSAIGALFGSDPLKDLYHKKQLLETLMQETGMPTLYHLLTGEWTRGIEEAVLKDFGKVVPEIEQWANRQLETSEEKKKEENLFLKKQMLQMVQVQDAWKESRAVKLQLKADLKELGFCFAAREQAFQSCRTDEARALQYRWMKKNAEAIMGKNALPDENCEFQNTELPKVELQNDTLSKDYSFVTGSDGTCITFETFLQYRDTCIRKLQKEIREARESESDLQEKTLVSIADFQKAEDAYNLSLPRIVAEQEAMFHLKYRAGREGTSNGRF